MVAAIPPEVRALTLPGKQSPTHHSRVSEIGRHFMLVDGVDDDALGVYHPIGWDAIKPSSYRPSDSEHSGDSTSALLPGEAFR